MLLVKKNGARGFKISKERVTILWRVLMLLEIINCHYYSLEKQKKITVIEKLNVSKTNVEVTFEGIEESVEAFFKINEQFSIAVIWQQMPGKI